jgi:hypothetical protein
VLSISKATMAKGVKRRRPTPLIPLTSFVITHKDVKHYIQPYVQGNVVLGRVCINGISYNVTSVNLVTFKQDCYKLVSAYNKGRVTRETRSVKLHRSPSDSVLSDPSYRNVKDTSWEKR